MVSPQNIRYNNEDIEDYLNPLTVILDVAFDSDNGETSSFLNRSAIASESHDGRYKNTHRYKYDELFSPKFTIVKKDFSDFTQSEVRQVLKYLTQTDKPALLEVSYDKNTTDTTAKEENNWCAVGGWTEISTYKLANNRTVGIVATFEAITPYAMSDLHIASINASTGYKAEINIDTDDSYPIYPIITIKEMGTSIKFVNSHTPPVGREQSYNSIELDNDTAGETITIDCGNKIISSSLTNRIFGDHFNWKWLELYDGKNVITVTGNCEVTIKYRTVIKCGEW